MAETLHDFSAAVENLISINRDAEQGFRAAADAVGDPGLKQMFVQLSAQRAAFAAEIQDGVRRLGFEPANPLGTGGTLHGIWIALKSAILANKAHATLEETERGEDLALKTYRDCMGMILQPELRTILERQYALIQESHVAIRTMRDQTAPPPTTPPATAPPTNP